LIHGIEVAEHAKEVDAPAKEKIALQTGSANNVAVQAGHARTIARAECGINKKGRPRETKLFKKTSQRATARPKNLASISTLLSMHHHTIADKQEQPS